MINVTKTFFPPLDEYQAQLQRIWSNQWLTNRGELVLELEEKLKHYKFGSIKELKKKLKLQKRQQIVETDNL